MKAIVIREFGGVDKLLYEEIETPTPGPGEVLVRVRAAGVNHLDHDIREGISGFPIELPHILGEEGCGDVAEVGAGVTRWQVGDRVSCSVIQPCGQCQMCLTGHDGMCRSGRFMGAVGWGTYAEYVLCVENGLVAMPDNLDYETAAASHTCFCTAVHMIMTLGKVRAGQTVLVNAAGSGVGTSAIQVAKLNGARVIATAGSDEKLAKAKELGADDGINYTTQTISEEAMRLTGGRGVDLVVECVGGEILQESMRALATNGSVVTCGAHAGEQVEIDIVELFRKQARLQGSFYASRHEISQALQLVADGKLTPAIHAVMPLSEARQAAELTANRNFFGKMVLLP